MQRNPTQLDYSSPAAEIAQPRPVPPLSWFTRVASVCAAGWFFGVACWWIAWFSFNAKGAASAIALVLKYLPVIGVGASVAALASVGSGSGRRRETLHVSVALLFNLLWLCVVILITWVTSVLNWDGIRG